MTTPTYDLPADFQWGVATSAYQIEGAVTADGRGPSIWDTLSHTPGATARGQTGDIACDHYHRYAEDVALLRDLGVNTYRFSLAWPRILPEGTGRVNRAGVDFYRRLCESLLAVGITPTVMLYHWDLPQALQDRGGWLESASVEWFAEYAATAKRELGDVAQTWATLNEPYCTAFLGHGSGEHAPGVSDPGVSLLVAHHLMLAHHRALKVLRQTAVHDSDRLGIMLNLIPAWPADDDPAHAPAARAVDLIHNRLFADAVLHGRYPPEMATLFAEYGVADRIDEAALTAAFEAVDYLGINYYNVNFVEHAPGAPAPRAFPGAHGARLVRPPGRLTEMGWGVHPEGLTWMLQRVAKEYPPLPLIVSENGAAYPDQVGPDGIIDDPDRIDYLDRHVAALAEARSRGVDVRGYHVWSLLDNFEWARGYAPRFGIVAVDPVTQERSVKRSYAWYRDLITRHR